MKFLRLLGIILLLLIAVVLVAGLIAPKDISTERSVTINASQAVVANQMFQFSNFKNWSPWQELDPNMKTFVEGIDGQVGSIYKWEGTKDVGEGNMVVTNRTNDEMDVDLNFIKPFEKQSKGSWKVTDAGNNQSKASWGFSTHYDYPMNGIMMLMGMKHMLDKDFDKGLNKLKAYIESNKASLNTTPEFDIQQTQFNGGNYAPIRKTISFSDMNKFFSDSYSTITKVAGDRINGKAIGIFYTYNETNETSDVASGFPVKGTEKIKDVDMIDIPSSPSYMISYKGGYSGSYAAHKALEKKANSDGKKVNLVVEEYAISPEDTNDSNAYVTNIYYLFQ